MALISVTLPADGETIDAADVNNPFNTIVNEINGSLDADNIAASAITSVKIADSAVTAPKLSTSAILLGYSEITTSAFSSTASDGAEVTGLATTVTVPAGSRRVKITVYGYEFGNASNNFTVTVKLWDGAVGGTELQRAVLQNPTSSSIRVPLNMVFSNAPAAGSKTYRVSLATSDVSKQAIISAASGRPAFMLVEAV